MECFHHIDSVTARIPVLALGKSRPTSKAEMIGTVRRHLHRRQKEPHVIRNLFKEKHVRYAA
ncbi:hypothetical protein [Burkholderia cenocepacia]|uniref:hypothetical protein n=1 Tax=Burkholderia cenocepacia TaxID=95486 RepID=UPI002013BAB9|nr:hypothetical protein [Burkholderia cenocepacia]